MTRDERQEEFAGEYLNQKGNGILYLCPRFGKCRVAIKIFDQIKGRILISYPDSQIKSSWEEEFNIMGVTPDVDYVTHRSLHKYKGCQDYDLVVIDEIHLLSAAQIAVAKKIKSRILGLTGTMTEWTEKDLLRQLKLPVISRYPIDLAIEEGVLSDYQIFVKLVKLDDKVIQRFGKKRRTEKKHYDAYSWVMAKLEEEKKDTMFIKLGRMRVVQNSLAKLKATKDLIKQFKDERILVFCGLTKIADKLGIASYHNKVKEQKVFDDFTSGVTDKLAVVKIGNTGVTYKPLSKVIINYFDSNAENLAQRINRCMAMEYDNPEKRAQIWIVSTDEPAEIGWLQKALEFFDQNKIKYVK